MVASGREKYGRLNETLEEFGIEPDGACHTCNTHVGPRSHFCGDGHDALLIQAALRNDVSRPYMLEALRVHMANPQ